MAAKARGNINTGLIQEMNTDLKELSAKYLKMAAEWSIMKNRADKAEERAREMDHKIDRILHILENDNSTGSPGLVQQVRENTKFISGSKNQLKVIGIVAGTVGGFLMSFLIKLIFK